MRLKTEYIIKPETVLVLPQYNEYGHLHTWLCNRNGISKVDLSPFHLLDYNLRCLGSSIRGAQEGAQALLGKVSMNPVVLDNELDIVLFPSRSPSRDDCVWFSLRHIDGAVSVGKNQTRVLLSNGSSITVDISKHIFDKRIQKAYEFRFKVQARKRQFEEQVSESGVPYHLAKVENGVNYEEGVWGS